MNGTCGKNVFFELILPNVLLVHPRDVLQPHFVRVRLLDIWEESTHDRYIFGLRQFLTNQISWILGN